MPCGPVKPLGPRGPRSMMSIWSRPLSLLLLLPQQMGGIPQHFNFHSSRQEISTSRVYVETRPHYHTIGETKIL